MNILFENRKRKVFQILEHLPYVAFNLFSGERVDIKNTYYLNNTLLYNINVNGIQIMYAYPFSLPRTNRTSFLVIYLHVLKFMEARSQGSGEAAWMCRLPGALTASQWDKYMAQTVLIFI